MLGSVNFLAHAALQHTVRARVNDEAGQLSGILKPDASVPTTWTGLLYCSSDTGCLKHISTATL
jgi:hypothetical protein